jgi:hypothetical protein
MAHYDLNELMALLRKQKKVLEEKKTGTVKKNSYKILSEIFFASGGQRGLF